MFTMHLWESSCSWFQELLPEPWQSSMQKDMVYISFVIVLSLVPASSTFIKYISYWQCFRPGESKIKGFHRFWVLYPDGMEFVLLLFYRFLQFVTCNIKENNFCVKIKYLCLCIIKKKLTYVYKFMQAK